MSEKLLEEIENLKNEIVKILKYSSSYLSEDLYLPNRYEPTRSFYLTRDGKIEIRDVIRNRYLNMMSIEEYASAYGIGALESALAALIKEEKKRKVK